MGERDNCDLGPSIEARVVSLEPRVDRLERAVEDIRNDIKGIHRELGEIRGMVSGLRTAITIGFTLTGCALGGIAAILAAILYVLMTG